MLNVGIGNGVGGATRIVKSGSGFWSLTGANSFSGPVDVLDGTLELLSTGSAGTNAAYTVAASGNLVIGYDDSTVAIGSLAGAGSVRASDYDLGAPTTQTLVIGGDNASTTFSGILRDSVGTLAVSKVGTGTQALSGNNTFTGGTTLAAGGLNLQSNTALGTGPLTITSADTAVTFAGGVTINNPITLASTATLNVVGGSATQAGAIGETGGSFGVQKTGPGTLVLTGQSTYTGDTTITGGTLALANNASNSGGSTLQSPTITVEAGATLRFDTSDNFGNHATTAGPDITVDGGTVTNSAAAINALQNHTLNDGTLNAVGEFGQFGAFSVRNTLTSTGNSTIDLGTNRLTVGQDGDTTFNVTSGTLSVASTIADNVDGPGTLNKTGGGTLLLTGANTFSGGVSTSDFGTLAINSDAALGNATNAIRFNNGALRTDAAMTITRDVNIDTGRVAFFNTNGNDVTLAGRIDGQAGFIKQGAGTLTLTNHANGQWNNRIDAGTLAITDDRQLGLPGGTLFLHGGTLRVNDSITVDRPFNVLSDSTIAFGNRDITLAGSLDVPTGTTLTLDGDANGGVLITANATGAGTTVLRAETVAFGVAEPTLFVIGDGGTNGSLPSGPIRFEAVDNDSGRGQAQLAFDRSDTYTVASDLTGAELQYIIIRGGGTLVYTGNNNTFSSNTRVVDNSSLVLDGQWSGRVFVGGTDPLTNVGSAGTLGGTGTIAQGVAVGTGAAGTIRGDWGTGTGTLTMSRGLNIRGGVDGGTIAIQLLTDAAGNLLDQSNLSASDFVFTSVFGPLSVQLLNDAALTLGQTYTIELVEARSGRFTRDSAFNLTSYPASDFNLLSSSGWTFANVTPHIQNNRPMLSFTAVPEPASLSVLAGAGVLALRRGSAASRLRAGRRA